MGKQRRVRRISGWIARYVSDDLLEWGAKADGRSTRGRIWKDPKPLLKIALLGLLAGCKGPKEVEELSADLSKPVRRLLGLPRRIPDTTLRDFLTKLDPVKLQNMLWVVGYDANRRKALRQRTDVEIPFGVVSSDGKYPSISDTNPYKYLQVHHQDDVATHGLVRTVTCCLATACGRPILGAVPVLGSTNEQGSFKKAFGDMVRIYGRLFRVVMYDAGAASQSNADAVKAAKKEYVFLIANEEWQIYKTMELLLKDKAPAYIAEEVVSDTKRVIRRLKMQSLKPLKKDRIFWKHTRTIFRLEVETHEDGRVTTDVRHSVSSLDAAELAPKQWWNLHLIRWDSETAHGVLDTAFAEDERPWIRKNAQGNLAVQLLRRVAYTLMTLYKHVTIRNEDESLQPWRKHMEWLKDALKWARSEDVANLRAHTFAVPPALA